MPLTEIWMCELKSGVSTAKSFDSTQTIAQHCRWAIDICSHMLTMDPNLVDTHYIRTDWALWIGHERTQEFLEEFDAAMKPENYSAGSCAAFCSLVLRSVPEIQERLMPMILLMARKAVEKEPENVDFLRTLGEAFYHTKDCENAEDILLRAFDLSIANSDLHDPKTTKIVKLLIQLYEAWNKPEQAEEWRAKLLQTEAVNE